MGTFFNVWKHFWLLKLGGGCYWHLVGRFRDAANHLTMHGTGPTRVSRSTVSIVLRIFLFKFVNDPLIFCLCLSMGWL